MSGGITERVSLRVMSGNPFGFSGILAPLSLQQGVVFPYTPTIQIGHSANYGSYDITHGFYLPSYYTNTPNPSISITANFTANTTEEAAHTAAAIHFFKTCTKMDYGEQRRTTAGTPPPILKLNIYGGNVLSQVHANNTPVVLRSFNYTLPEDVDYVSGTFGVVPTMVIVSLELTVQMSPGTVRKNFNIETFARGGLLGGFI
jgi:hypothetical protein